MTRRGPLAGPRGLGLLALAGCLAACEPKGAPGLDSGRLGAAIQRGFGGPGTCVVLRVRDRVAYRYGDPGACRRQLPLCDAAGRQSTEGASDARAVRESSCADGQRPVGWAAGALQTPAGPVHYAASMWGEGALPGRELKLRAERAITAATARP